MNVSAENYLKTIYILKITLGDVRSIDVAQALGVSKPSVSNAVKKLCKEDLVRMDESRNLFLTKASLRYAASIFERHLAIEKFLTEALDVDAKIAHSDSCRIEHLLSTEPFNKIKETYKE